MAGLTDVISVVIGSSVIVAGLISVTSIVASIVSIFVGEWKPSLISQEVCGNNFSTSPLIGIIASYIGFTIIFAGFLYLIGVLANRQDFLNYIKIEIPEIILIILTIPFVTINCLDVFNVGLNNFDAGKMLWVYSTLNLAVGIYANQITAAIIAPITTSTVSLGGIGQQPIQGFWMFFKSLFSNSLTMYSIATITSQIMLKAYDLLTYGFFVYLLPLAIILRALPFSRRLGGTLIGLTIGSIVILPFLCSALYAMFNGYGFIVFNPRSNNFDINVNHPFNNFFNIVTQNQGVMQDDRDVNSLLSKYENLFISIAGSSFGFSSLLLSRVLPGKIGSLVNVFGKLMIVASFAYALVTLVIFPSMITATIVALCLLVTLPLTLNGVKIFTGLYGEQLDISNLTRLI
jgi:hypothetical protein